MIQFDPDVFAYLYPAEGPGWRAADRTMEMDENKFRLLAPPQETPPKAPPPREEDRGKRDDTVPLEEKAELVRFPCLALRFSDSPKTNAGVVVGRGERADLRVHDIDVVSKLHFAITFDKDNEVVVKDLHSAAGTRVIYNGEDGPRGRGFTWSARGPPEAGEDAVPVINVVTQLQFKIFIPKYDTTSPAYIARVKKFFENTLSAEDLLSELDMKSGAATRAPASAQGQTPTVEGPSRIFWQKFIGHGSFGVVSYAWDVTSRETFALKELRIGDEVDWRKEADVLKGLSHRHIVDFKFAIFESELGTPGLYFEYVPGGDLRKIEYKSASPQQKYQLATQLLEGLGYLHDEARTAHRDIKPANVLIKSWSADSVHVLLADFGLSKQSDDLMTRCGTPIYQAPELYYERRLDSAERYTTLIDVWSLAVLLLEMECGRLPRYERHYKSGGSMWAKILVDFAARAHAERKDSPLLHLVREYMLVVDPQARQPAKKCLEKARELFGMNETDSAEQSDEENCPVTPTVLHNLYHGSVGRAVTPVLFPSRESPDVQGMSGDPGSEALAPGAKPLFFKLGVRNSDYVDVIAGMKPANIQEFEQSDASTLRPTHPRSESPGGKENPRALQRDDAGHGNPMALPEISCEPQAHSTGRAAGDDTVGDTIRAAVFNHLGQVAGRKEVQTSAHEGLSTQRKRPRQQGGPCTSPTERSRELQKGKRTKTGATKRTV